MGLQNSNCAAWCEYERLRCGPDCQFRVAENRLREAHRHWHECVRLYQDPEDFRISVNATVQALRNVTFALQSAKSNVTGFDDWYGQEQEAMKADPILRWSHQARNVIVKQGDLSTKSTLRVSLIADYENEAKDIASDQVVWGTSPGLSSDVSVATALAPSNLTIEEIFEELHNWRIPMSVKQNATVKIERRWVDDKMPEYELLTLLAYTYGRMNAIVGGAHNLLDMDALRVQAELGEVGGGTQDASGRIEEGPRPGRLPCMVSTRNERSTRLRLIDATPVKEFRNWKVEYDPEVASEAIRSGIYGQVARFPSEEVGELQKNRQLAVAIRHYASLARGIIRSGQDHGWFSYFFRQGRPVDSRVHVSVDGHGKRVIAAEIAHVALQLDADAVIMLSEAWVSPPRLTVDGVYVSPSLQTDRSEVIMLDAVAKSGARAGGILPFRTLSGEPPNRVVEVGEFQPQDGTNGILLATLAAWGGWEEPLEGDAFWRAQRRKS